MSDSGPNRWQRAKQLEDFPLEVGTVRCALCPSTFTGQIAGVYRRHAAQCHPHLPERTTVQSNKPPRGPTARERAVIGRRQAAVDALTDEPQTSAQIAAICGATDNGAVSRALTTAIRLGMQVERVSPAVWKLPEPGPEPDALTPKQERRKERDRERWPTHGAKPPPCPKCGRNDIASPGPYALHVSACTGDTDRTAAYIREGHVSLSAAQIRQIEEELAVSPRTAAELAQLLGVEDEQAVAIALTWARRKGKTRARKYGDRNHWSKMLWVVDESPEPIPPYVAALREALRDGPLTAPEIAVALGVDSGKGVGPMVSAAVKYGYITFTGRPGARTYALVPSLCLSAEFG
jgi:hypothetical protein